MKIMTFNIQHGRDYLRNVIDLPMFSQAICAAGADVCGLNEVRSAGPLEGYTDQVTALTKNTGLHGYFGEAIRVEGVGPYGNAILSRVPFRAVETIAIPDPEPKDELGYYESRCVIRAVVELEGREVCLLVCHMGLNRGERINAVKLLCELIDRCELPLIVMGDFNAVPADEELQPLFARLQDSTYMDAQPNGPTFPSDAPVKKIDHLLYRGLKCVRTETIHEIWSDHLPIIAEFEHLPSAH